ncbi:MAG: FkbM family methyltransferase [Pseudomonadota bacterium]
MPNFYSQHGEDFILFEIFKKKADGFFVEVGCIDGRRFSNTLVFEELGWKGICIEAHKDYMPLLEKNRPNSFTVHCAVGEKDEEAVTFYANARGSLSTLDKSREKYFKENYSGWFTGFEPHTVRKHTLNTVFAKYGVTHIDILSIDIEGYELEALQGLDLQIYQPAVLVIESDSPEHEAQLDKVILPKGYSKSICVGGNIFYLKDRKLQKNINNKFFKFEVTHTKHPLDTNGDLKVACTIDTRKQNKHFVVGGLRKIKNKIFPVRNTSPEAGQGMSEWGRMARRDRFKDIVSLIRNARPVIIDGGAFQGEMVQIFLSHYPHAQIFAFEPNMRQYAELLAKFSHAKNIKIYKQALGAEQKKLLFNVLRNEPSSSLMLPSEWLYKYHGQKMDVLEAIEVEQVRLDSLFPDAEIDILKLDVQGYELEALRGCSKMLDRIKLITTEIEFVPLYKQQPLFADIDQFLRSNQFRLFNVYGLWTQHDGQLTAGDAIYLNEKYFSAP